MNLKGISLEILLAIIFAIFLLFISIVRLDDSMKFLSATLIWFDCDSQQSPYKFNNSVFFWFFSGSFRFFLIFFLLSRFSIEANKTKIILFKLVRHLCVFGRLIHVNWLLYLWEDVSLTFFYYFFFDKILSQPWDTNVLIQNNYKL